MNIGDRMKDSISINVYILSITIFLMVFLSVITIKANSDIGTNIAWGNIIIVDEKGGGDYTEIQKAINSSKDGDIIRVYQGVYNENISIHKSLSIRK